MAKAKKMDAAGSSASKKESPSKKEPARKKAPAATAAAASEKLGATKKAATPKKPGKPEKAAGGAPSAPLIDTGLAAAAAAAMVANLGAAGLGGAATQGDATAGAASPSQRQESSTFRNLKQSLNKPASSGSLGGILGSGGGQKKFNQGFGGQKPSVPGSGGRNQTFGADVNRSGVPRRTGGG